MTKELARKTFNSLGYKVIRRDIAVFNAAEILFKHGAKTCEVE